MPILLAAALVLLILFCKPVRRAVRATLRVALAAGLALVAAAVMLAVAGGGVTAAALVGGSTFIAMLWATRASDDGWSATVPTPAAPPNRVLVAAAAGWEALRRHARWSDRKRVTRLERELADFVRLAASDPGGADADLLATIERRVPETIAICLRNCASMTSAECQDLVVRTVATLDRVAAEARRRRPALLARIQSDLATHERYYDSRFGIDSLSSG